MRPMPCLPVVEAERFGLGSQAPLWALSEDVRSPAEYLGRDARHQIRFLTTFYLLTHDAIHRRATLIGMHAVGGRDVGELFDNVVEALQRKKKAQVAASQERRPDYGVLT